MDGQTLFQPYCAEQIIESFQVSNLCNHSQRLLAGETFLAYPGTHQDGRQYLEEVIKRRPGAIVAEKNGFEAFKFKSNNIPVILIANLSDKLGSIASHFFGNPSEKLLIQAATGTNGKTTVTHLLHQTLLNLKVASSQIGTLGVESENYRQPLNLTTPDPIELHRIFSKLNQHGVQVVNMEVSSHALAQARVASVPFKTAIFTNLTPEHLDYHKDMESYGAAKLSLFQTKTLQHAILNDEDPYSATILARMNSNISVSLVTTLPNFKVKSFNRWQGITTENFALTAGGIEASIQTSWGKGHLKSKLIGHFNLSNCLLVVAALCQQGYPLEDVLAALAKVTTAPGRMQAFGGASLPQVFVDYAHTPDALKQALGAARSACKRKLWCVFGCGGNRDKEKRQMMGQIASEFADRVVITNDNPRDEEPWAIIEDILAGIPPQYAKKIVIEEDRKKAIEYAVERALSFDVILVAGKGHEAVQKVKNQQLPFSDIQHVKNILGNK